MSRGRHPERQAYTEDYHKAQQNESGLRAVLEASGNLYTIEGCDHSLIHRWKP